MPNRECCESRKNILDSTRLNPKYCNSGQSAAKLQIGEGSTTIPYGSKKELVTLSEVEETLIGL